MSDYYIVRNGILYHWGIKGMKWGVRRFQNKDGSLTPAGKARIKLSASEMKHISEKSRRSKLTQAQTISELKKITACSHDPNFKGISPEEKKWLELDKEIREFSGDWYTGKGVSKAFSDRTDKYEKDDNAVDNKYSAAVKEARNKYYDMQNDLILSYTSPANRESIKTSDRIVDYADYDKAYAKAHAEASRDSRIVKAKADLDKISRKYSDERAEIRVKYENDILGIVLNDLGYKDSPEARALIRDTVIWD